MRRPCISAHDEGIVVVGEVLWAGVPLGRAGCMATAEERLAALETRVDEHSRGLAEVRAAIVNLEQRIDRRFDAVDRRFEALDRRFEALDRRFEGIDARLAGMDGRLSGLDDKFSRYFVWMLGAQVSTLAAIVAVLARG